MANALGAFTTNNTVTNPAAYANGNVFFKETDLKILVEDDRYILVKVNIGLTVTVSGYSPG